MNVNLKFTIAFYFTFSFLINYNGLAQKRPNIMFLLADDWSYPYSSIYGNKNIRTPNMEILAKQGVVFDHAFCATPSCTPSRAGVLTGKYPHNLGEGVNLCGKLDVNIPTYVKILRENGYNVAYDRKGWEPGDFKKMGYTENPCGEKINTNDFIDKQTSETPFFFWFGTTDPHRPYNANAGKIADIDVTKINVPAFLPDTPEIREDLSDYISEIEHFDKEIGEIIEKLKSKGLLENTIFIVTGDNGMPFPHAKANLYDFGTRVPLIISSFSNLVAQNKVNSSFVNLIDLTPTFLDLAKVKNTIKMDGISLLPIIQNKKNVNRSEIYLERERHCLCRAELNTKAGYPMRAIRTHDFLYIQNLRPNRNPAGDETIPNTVSEYGDIDGGISKMFLMDHRNDPKINPFFKLSFEKRSPEELYDIKKDPYNIHNLAYSKNYSSIKNNLKTKLENWMKNTNDPRVDKKNDAIDHYNSTTRAWITRDGIKLLDN